MNEETRKVKPWPIVPDDIEPVAEHWQTIGSFMVGAVLAMLIVLFGLIFFTCLYMWGLIF